MVKNVYVCDRYSQDIETIVKGVSYVMLLV